MANRLYESPRQNATAPESDKESEIVLKMSHLKQRLAELRDSTATLEHRLSMVLIPRKDSDTPVKEKGNGSPQSPLSEMINDQLEVVSDLISRVDGLLRHLET
jgi:hypothetical protein